MRVRPRHLPLIKPLTESCGLLHDPLLHLPQLLLHLLLQL